MAFLLSKVRLVHHLFVVCEFSVQITRFYRCLTKSIFPRICLSFRFGCRLCCFSCLLRITIYYSCKSNNYACKSHPRIHFLSCIKSHLCCGGCARSRCIRIEFLYCQAKSCTILPYQHQSRINTLCSHISDNNRQQRSNSF